MLCLLHGNIMVASPHKFLLFYCWTNTIGNTIDLIVNSLQLEQNLNHHLPLQLAQA